MPEGLFEIDDAGWKAQQKGRSVWELVRELLQNGLDNGTNVVVTINTRKRQVTVRNYGDGFDDLSQAYTIFSGDKGGDPTKRGRFGRGLKEAVGASKKVTVMSTAGTVEFDVESNERIEHDRTVDEGTKVTIQNDEWSKEEMDEVKEYVFKLWPPEGQEIYVRLKGGRNQKSTRWEPEKTFRAKLNTVVINDGVMETEERRTDVHIRKAEPNEDGRVYEMGIPISLNEDFPFYVDVQQKVPMAEQRNEPDSSWMKKFVPELLNQTYQMLDQDELQEGWVQNALESWRVNSAVKEYYTEKCIEDNDKAGSVLPGDDKADDKVRNYGYEVVDLSKLSAGAASAAKGALRDSDQLAQELHERNEEQIPIEELSENQIAWLEFAARTHRRLQEDFDMPDVTFEFWEIEPSFEGKCPNADTNGTTIRFNTFKRGWDRVDADNVGTLVHELAHTFSGVGHGETWYYNMQDMFSELLVQEGIDQ